MIPRIAVIDSGWSAYLPEPRVETGRAFLAAHSGSGVLESSDTTDRIGHGTACTELLLRHAPRARIVPVRVFENRLETSPAALIAAIGWACDARVNIINLSLGSALVQHIRPIYRACAAATRSGVLIVAAAGRGTTGWSVPAVFDVVLGVSGAALDQRFGYRPGEAIEFAAPDRHRVRWLDQSVREVAGSSFAVPIATSVLARELENDPALTLDAARRALDARSGMSIDEAFRPVGIGARAHGG